MMDKSLDELKSAFNVLLNIPNIEVDEVERDREGNYRVTIHSTERGTRCHQCGHFIDHKRCSQIIFFNIFNVLTAQSKQLFIFINRLELIFLNQTPYGYVRIPRSGEPPCENLTS